MTDGKTRRATIEDICEGNVLRNVDSNGYSYPFSDMVITKTYLAYGEMRFDCARPHPGGVERVNYIGTKEISSRYHAVLLASGKVATHHYESLT